MSSEPRPGIPYSLAEHIYSGGGLESLPCETLEELAAILTAAERKAAQPMGPGNVDQVIAACLRTAGDPFTQWKHELVVDESLRAIVAMLLPAPMLDLQRIMAERLLQRSRSKRTIDPQA